MWWKVHFEQNFINDSNGMLTEDSNGMLTEDSNGMLTEDLWDDINITFYSYT